MKINELLFELTDKPEKISAELVDDDVWEISAKNINLYLYLTRGIGPDGKDSQVYIEFAVNSEYKLTGKGNAIKILSTVVAMLKEYLSKFIKKTDNYVSFGAEKSEPSRVSLYQRAVPIITNILRGWKYNEESIETDSSLKIFTWVRV